MNNPNHQVNSGDYHTDLQCTPFILDCTETANAHCARLCQTEIALVPSSPITDLYNKITYIDQEKINEDALRIIDIPQKAKRRSLLPVSKFGLTDLSRPQETIVRKNETEEMSCQTDLMISPHILNNDEKAVISMSSSCQTTITCSPSISMIDFYSPPPTDTSDLDNEDEREQLYKNAAEILTEIVHDVMTIPQRMFDSTIIKPVIMKLSRTSCLGENSQWNMLMPEGNTSYSQIRDNNDDKMFDVIMDNSCQEDVIYCRSDDNISVDSTVSEISSMVSLDYTHNSIEEDFPVYAEIVENDAIIDFGNNQSPLRLASVEDNKK